MLSPALVKKENITGIGQYLVDYPIPIRNMSTSFDAGIFSFIVKVDGGSRNFFHLVREIFKTAMTNIPIDYQLDHLQ